MKKLLLLSLLIGTVFSEKEKLLKVVCFNKNFPTLFSDPTEPYTRILVNSDRKIYFGLGSSLDFFQFGIENKLSLGFSALATTILKPNLKPVKDFDCHGSVPLSLSFKNTVYLKSEWKYNDNHYLSFTFMLKDLSFENNKKLLLPLYFYISIDIPILSIETKDFVYKVGNEFDFISIKYPVAPYLGANVEVSQKYNFFISYNFQLGLSIGKPERNRMKIIFQYFLGKSPYYEDYLKYENNWSIGLIY